MDPQSGDFDARNNTLIKLLACLMFMMFAMTTDAVGSVIPVIIKEFHLTMTAAGTFHYVPMSAIGLGAILLGFLADRLGRQRTIVAGLVLYGVSSGQSAPTQGVYGTNSYYGNYGALGTIGEGVYGWGNNNGWGNCGSYGQNNGWGSYGGGNCGGWGR